MTIATDIEVGANCSGAVRFYQVSIKERLFLEFNNILTRGVIMSD